MPLRIVLLITLVYLAYRILTAGKKTVPRQESRKPPHTPESVVDQLVEDPMCHTFVPQHQAISAQIHQKTYYFCSKECLAKYRAQQGEN